MIPTTTKAAIPREPWCLDALEYALQALPEPILNHSLRVFLIARWLAEVEGGFLADAGQLPYLFAASIFHDMGACDLHNGTQRFEVEGADAAKNHLLAHGVSEADSHRVWVAIAVHTSAGIAERIDPLARLIRLAVKIDFSPTTRDKHGAGSLVAEIEKDLPRLGVEKALADAVVGQAREGTGPVGSTSWPDSEKHPKASWPGILLRAHRENPHFEGINPAF